jgi:hypothetical protein
MGLTGIDVDPVVDSKRRGVKPGAIGEKRVAADVSDGGLEVQAASDGHCDDLVIVGSEDGGELAKALGVAAPSETDEKFAADAKDVAALEGAGKRDVGELSKGRKRVGERRRFGAARSVPSGRITLSSGRWRDLDERNPEALAQRGESGRGRLIFRGAFRRSGAGPARWRDRWACGR